MRIAAVHALAFLLLAPRAGAEAEADVLAREASRVAAVTADERMRSAARRLWGRSLDVPVVVHDAAAGRSLRVDRRGIAAVTLPRDIPVANTCIRLDGADAALVLAPLPDEPADLAALVWHERWHCAQESIGLGAREAANAHLDSEQGRRWLRLELRALAAALAATDAGARRDAARAALAFRAERHDRFPGAGAQEAALERNEGLAEYSGRRIAHADPAFAQGIVAALRRGDEAPSHVRSFAYLTGPAYGALLDPDVAGWRSRLAGGSGPAELLAPAYGLDAASRPSGADLARFGDADVSRQERQRQVRHRARIASLRARLVDGPVLRIPLRKPMASFDPNALLPLGEDGIVHEPLTVNDDWGRLESTSPALLAGDWRLVRVPMAGATGCGRAWRGAGWSLELAEGWRAVGAGEGLVVERGEPPACD